MREYFKNKIKIHGPISISDYMSENNLSPNKGYYNLDNIIGKKGDFITSPEVSQIFGELIGLFIIDYWYLSNKPYNPILIDLGGGNGTLMKDCLRAINKVDNKFYEALSPIFIETSSMMMAKQKNNIPNSKNYKDFNKLPNNYISLIANEFFDALPIKQYIRINNNWHERLIDLDPNNENKFRFVYAKKPSTYLKKIFNFSSKHKIIEVCINTINIVKEISYRINNYGGIALIIDYALQDDDYFGSFQAIKKHNFIDPLSEPGFIDLSARVNFDLIKKTAIENGANVYGPITQNKFLKRLGIDIRCQQLIKANPEKTELIQEQYNKLMSKNEMGSIFKVLAITNKNSSTPTGF